MPQILRMSGQTPLTAGSAAGTVTHRVPRGFWEIERMIGYVDGTGQNGLLSIRQRKDGTTATFVKVPITTYKNYVSAEPDVSIEEGDELTCSVANLSTATDNVLTFQVFLKRVG